MLGDKKKKEKENEDDDYEMGEFRGKYIMYDRLFFEVDKAVAAKHLRREMFRFFMFVVTFMPYVVLQNSVTHSFAVENTLRETFVRSQFHSTTDTLITFDDIDTVDNFWRWCDQILVERMYNNTASPTGPHAVKNYNELLWGVRLRQARVKSKTACDLPPVILDAGVVDKTKCTTDFSQENMDTQGFGGILKASNTSLYRWKPAAETGDLPMESRASINPVVYSGAGHIYDLNTNRTAAQQAIKWMACWPRGPNELLTEASTCVPFIDKQTRGVFVQFSTINVNYDLFVRSEFRIEFAVSGWVETEAIFYHGQLVERASSTATFIVFLDILLCIIIILDTLKFLGGLRTRGLNNVNLWTLVDAVMYFVFCIHVYDSVRRGVFLDDQLQIVSALDSGSFYNTSSLLLWYRTMQQLYALNTILLIVRTFKYLNLTSGLQSVFRTLAMAFKDMIYFFVLFFLMFFGFVFSGYVLFGPRSADFKTLRASSVTLLRMAIGDIDYNRFVEADPDSAPYFFVIFTVLFYFVMTNIFLSIILDVWHKEKERLDKQYAREENIDIMSGWRRTVLDLGEYLTNPRTYRRFVRQLKQPRTCLPKVFRYFCGDPSNMTIDEVKERLKLWRLKRQNQHTVFMHFALVLKALEGGLLDHKDVTDEQVRGIMSLCKQPINSRILYIYDREQKEAKLASMSEGLAESPSMDEFAAKDIGLTSMKRLIQALGMVHTNQSKYWGKITTNLEAVQMQSASMQRKMETLHSRMDQLVPKLGSAHGGRGLDDRNN